MVNTKRVKQCLSIFLIGLSPSVLAVDEFEREALSRLLNELSYLDNIILVAKNSGGDRGGVQFDYKALEDDLQRIEHGIAEYLNGMKREPRAVQDVSGDYSLAR